MKKNIVFIIFSLTSILLSAQIKEKVIGIWKTKGCESQIQIYEKDEFWGGTICNPESGRTYDAFFELKKDSQLCLKGYVGVCVGSEKLLSGRELISYRLIYHNKIVSLACE